MKILILIMLVFANIISMEIDIMKDFKSEEVQNYAYSVSFPPKEFSGYVQPPKAFQIIVDSGKSFVPDLIASLNDKNGKIRLSSFLALNSITNKNFGSYKDYLFNENMRENISKWNDWWRSNKNKSQKEWLIIDLNSNDIGTKKRAIIKIGNLYKTKAIPDLRKTLSDSSVFNIAVQTLAKISDPYVITYLVNDFLTSDYLVTRQDGIKYLKIMTGQTFEYDPKANEKERAKSIVKWKKWLETNKKNRD